MSFSNINGMGLVFKGVNLQYKKSIFYPDQIALQVNVASISKFRVSFYIEMINAKNELCTLGIIECAFINPIKQSVCKVPQKLINIIDHFC